MARIPEPPEGARHDLTPMIDCVFLLIVFFLCIDFRVLEAKVPALLPKDLGASPMLAPPEEQLVVRVVCTARGEPRPRAVARGHRLVGHRIEWRVGPLPARNHAELVYVLRRVAREARAEPLPVVVEPGAGTTYGDVAQTLDAVRAAGFAVVRFATVR